MLSCPPARIRSTTIRYIRRNQRRQERLFSTSTNTNVDFTHAIIGGGIVGLSIARHLSLTRPNTTTILLERHPALGTETTSRNSEVIHAGLYYPPSSLKTRLCIRGKHLLYDLCASPAHNIPHRRTGKWILAQDAEQLDRLQRMHEHAARLGVPTRFLARGEIARREPDVRARAGVLESPSTGIVDSHALMACLHAEFEGAGGDVALWTAVSRIEKVGVGGGYRIYTRSAGTGREARDSARGGEGEGDEDEAVITAEALINAAGHNACAISNMLLPSDRHVRPAYAKGTYFSYSASSPKPRTLLYPAPKPGLGGLGTHLTLDMTGQVRFGPDVEWVDGPEDLVPRLGRLEDAVREIQEYLPGVRPEAIGLDYCGVRPKLAVKEGEDRGAFRDFVIREEECFEGFVNLLGIESPGLTSALAIGEMVEELLYG
ncbi:NAD dehydrogenase [Histoplasma capsulatum G186AR]|uniref:L-2-hydroxyglutarate dehydrogenase, mitochondrial n=1 Tax=Ajellomyces capsulatus (strain G186AR / H82 / ATCC MYA-2454 / RMSCC 2432) TaxID=447093 RepID=C0NSS3_AJECG|nr:NAD dehydrogenase [Histoplasma capsulatum G186AR]EEH05939.1 NAD dehydrogenase [Histoplasma capsulatum G186AR]